MSEIKVQCIDQAISFLNTPVISSGNVNYDTIVFDFCSRWDGYVKTAIFYRNKDEVYYQLLANDRCIIPNEVLGEKGVIYIGVFGTQGDKTITSQVLTYRIQEGAVTEDLKPADPTPDIYAQIVGKQADFENELADQSDRIGELEDKFTGAVGNAETLGGHASDYFATAKSVIDITSGTTPAGDSNKLGGKSASDWQNNLDNVGNRINNSVDSYDSFAELYNKGTGIYAVYILGTDRPIDSGDYYVIQKYRSATLGTQIAVSHATNAVYIRRLSDTWTTWEELATTADDTSLTGWTELTSGFDLDNALGKYRTASSTVLASLVNRPESVGYGEITVEWFPSTSNNQYGTQVIKHTYSTSPTMWARTRQSTTWTAWQKLATNVDLANYLPLTGGTVSGNVTVKNTSSGATAIEIADGGNNIVGRILANAKQIGMTNDTTGEWIFASKKDGTTSFNGTATGNLPLTGGEVNGTVRVNSNDLASIMAHRKNSNGSTVAFSNESGILGYLGMSGSAIPTFFEADVSKFYPLLHAGNSAKVVVSETPLTAEGSVRVW